MKRLLLFTAVLLYCPGVFAQQSNKANARPVPGGKSNSISVAQAKESLKKNLRKRHATIQVNGDASQRLIAPVMSQVIASEYIIGSTTWDLQTNGTISNHLINNGDSTLSAVWTMSQSFSPWADRGTGYNYFDGNTWGPVPILRTEPFRTGSTNIAVSTSGEEIVLAHTATTTNGLPLTSRAIKGTGSWTTTTLIGTDDNDLWPKITAGGANEQSFHVIWQGTGTAIGPLYYSRSTDNGATWSSAAQIPGLDTGVYYRGWGADSYSIDVRGDVIAVVAGDLGADLVLVKSTDNGFTWTKTIIDSFPIHMYDGATMNTDTNNDGTPDTMFSNTSDPAVVIDNNNQVHVFFGGTRVLEAPGATGLSYFFTTDLYYWNENMGSHSSILLATPPDLNGDGIISLPTGCNFDPFESPVSYYATGLYAYIQLPSAGVDANNNIYLVYQAVDELSDTNLYGQLFMHPYLIKSVDGGATWTNKDMALDVVLATQPDSGEHYDGVYAAMAKLVDSKVHIIYQRDSVPGTTWGCCNGFTPTCQGSNNVGHLFDIVYTSIDTAAIVISVHQPTANIPSFTVSANYPNPFNGKTSFDINLEKFSDVSVEVSNMLGETLSFNKYSNLSTGVHTLTIDGSKFSSGIYMYKVKAGNDVVTRKMIVQ